MRYDAVIFDIDGVLVEPTDPDVHRDAVRAAFAAFDIEPVEAETVERLVELTGDHRDQLSAPTVRQVCRNHGIDPESFWQERERIAAEAQLDEVEAGRKRRYPDATVVEEIGDRETIPLAAISNNQQQLVTAMLGRYELLDHFTVSFGREPELVGIERRKPNPYYARQAMTTMGATQPVLVGDSEVDLVTADRLGIDSVFVRRAHRQGYRPRTEPDHEIWSLTELTEVLDG